MSVTALVTPEPRSAVRVGAHRITITDFIETDRMSLLSYRPQRNRTLPPTAYCGWGPTQ